MRTKVFALSVLMGALFVAVVLSCAPFKDDVIKVTFPKRFEKLILLERHQYQEPGLGYSLRYQGEHLFKVDVYVYDKNLTDIGDGTDSKRVMEEFDCVISALSIMEEVGRYKDVKEVARGTTTFPMGNLQFLWARHQFRRLPGKGDAYLGLRISETYLSAKSGKFIKVRLTLKEEEFKERQGEIIDFMKYLASRLGSQQAAPKEKTDSRDAKFYNNRGIAYGKKGQYDEAILDFNKALEINPRYAEAYNNRGYAYYGKGQYDKGISDYNKALEIDPKYVFAYNNRGIAYKAKQQYDQAISDYTKALEIEPKATCIYELRADVYYLNKEYDKAWEDIKKAQDLGHKIPPKFLDDLRKASGREK